MAPLWGSTYGKDAPMPTTLTQTVSHTATHAARPVDRSVVAPPARRDSGWTLRDVEVVVHGSIARVRYTTQAPLVEVLVSTRRPVLVEGTWIEPVQACSGGIEFGGGRGTVDVLVQRVQPGITYHYVLTVPTRADEQPVQVVGTFTAESRIPEAVAALVAA